MVLHICAIQVTQKMVSGLLLIEKGWTTQFDSLCLSNQTFTSLTKSHPFPSMKHSPAPTATQPLFPHHIPPLLPHMSPMTAGRHLC